MVLELSALSQETLIVDRTGCWRVLLFSCVDVQLFHSVVLQCLESLADIPSHECMPEAKGLAGPAKSFCVNPAIE